MRKRCGTHHSITRQPLFIGTHALLTGGFDLPKLGLVIIDEQHKFGVAQRETLVRKGNYPHLLVMTATPIPRTLGLTLYGDLDVSVIDEMPGGRGKIKTFVRTTDKLPKVFEFIREKISGGRQAYIVYPRVEVADTDKDIKAVTKEFENVQTRADAVQSRLAARADQAGGKGRGDGGFSREQNSGARRHVADRSRRGRAERDGDAHRKRGAFRAGAVAPVARAHRARRARELLHFDFRRAERRRRRRG